MLDVFIKGKPVTLAKDFSIDMEDVNPFFNDAESFSYPIPILIEENRHIVGNIDHPQSTERPVSLEKEEIRIVADGVPFRSGLLTVSDGQTLSNELSVSLVSSVHSIYDQVQDLICQDIPVKDKIQIGEMIGDVEVSFNYKLKFQIKSEDKGFLSWSSSTATSSEGVFNISNDVVLQALGFSFPGICQQDSNYIATKIGDKPVVTDSFTNVTDEYPAKAYCNSRVCYTHYKKSDDGLGGSEIIHTEDQYDPFYPLEADRPQSGVCFYLLYFLDCLFHSLGINYKRDALLNVGDMKRLAFFTTHCRYDLEPVRGGGSFDFTNIESINSWLSSRNAGGALSFDTPETKNLDSVYIEQYGKTYSIGDKLPNGEKLESAQFIAENINSGIKANVMKMYANSQNFPESGVSDILNSFWASFGVKFLYDTERNTVEAHYIRDVFRDTSEPLVFHCDVVSVTPISENLSGVFCGYEKESSNVEKRNFVYKGVKDYDTAYDYTDYSDVDSSKAYLDIIRQQSATDKTCYIDKTTGNAYRLKVDKEAEVMSELRPSLFEVGMFSGVQLGDCSDENEDNIVRLASKFQPIVPTDINGRNQMSIGSSSSTQLYSEEYGDLTVSEANANLKQQILAMYIDEQMWHEHTPFVIRNAVGSDHADFSLDQTITTAESYDPTQTDDGNSPLQTLDWGLSVGIMRGGGSDARIENYDYNYDGFGNWKWRTKAGVYAMTSDTIDNWGNIHDYNGVQPGVGNEERFSLKPRAYKEVDGEILCNADIYDSEGNIETKIRSRGAHDTFMAEYTHFLLNRRKLQIKILCQVADLTNIQWARRYRVGEYVGWINRLSYNLSIEKGLGLVTMELYVL